MSLLTKRDLIFTLVIILVPLCLALSADAYDKRIMTLAGIYSIAALGYQLIFGRLGALSLAQGCFFGLGAYSASLIGIHLEVNFVTSLLFSIGLTSFIAAMIAIPVLRLESHYFALATLGVAQIVLLIAINWTDITGGANGLYGVPQLDLFGIKISSPDETLLFVWVILIVSVTFTFWVTREPYNYQLTLLRDAPEVAASSGIDIGAWRLKLFLSSAVLGAIAGALQAYTIGVVSPATLEFQVMITILAMTVIGGKNHPAGAIIGAILLTHLPEWFRFLEAHYLMAYGATLLVVIIVMPNGIIGLFKKLIVIKGDISSPKLTPMNEERKLEQRELKLELKNISKRYGGVMALDDVSMSVTSGQILGLVGPNGSGKSTLINVITGLQKQDEGIVLLGNRNIDKITSHKRSQMGIARTYQTSLHTSELTVLNSLLACSKNTGYLETREKKVRHIIAEANLSSKADTMTNDLTAVEARKFDLCMALATEPAILLLDEPAAGLNLEDQKFLSTAIINLAKTGISILIVDHTMDFLLPLADRLICLNEGSIIAEGTPKAVSVNPRAISAYFGSTKL